VASGAKTDRARLLKALDEGDVLLVTRLNRLASCANGAAWAAPLRSLPYPRRSWSCAVCRVRPNPITCVLGKTGT
jgi:hypothetical protein